MNNKIMLKDYIGKSDINIIVNVSIKGQKYDSNSMDNEYNTRVLKKVSIRKEKGKQWLYVEWQPEGEIVLNDKSTFRDCGYSGLMIDSDLHPLDNLYMVMV